MGALWPVSVVCPCCGEQVRLPRWWMWGVEGRFRCRSCDTRFRIGYKAGAVIAGIGWTAGYAALQFFAFVFSAQVGVLFFFLFIPVSIWITYRLRLAWLKRVVRRQAAVMALDAADENSSDDPAF